MTANEPVAERLRRLLQEHAYPGYVYGYPHKKAYRPLDPPLDPAQVWAEECRRALFCYVHIPFCTVRCSFCNLYTHVPSKDPSEDYLDTLARHMEQTAQWLGPAPFAHLSVGGGTPTFLSSSQLVRLVRHLNETLGIRLGETFSGIEASPETLDADKVATLRQLGFARLSLGVQSFVPEELRGVNRRFDFACHARALTVLAEAQFPHLNLDLIYGLPGQTRTSWRYSLDEAIRTAATSLFLYPLYIRPGTGLDGRMDLPPAPSPHEMGELYEIARERLAQAGFRQRTTRQFLRGPHSCSGAATEYQCQRDAMLGLGPGARSYTRRVHYSVPWKMTGPAIRAGIDAFGDSVHRGDIRLRHGFLLDEEEQCRRTAILSLLHEGLDVARFQAMHRVDPLSLFAPVWEALVEQQCAVVTPEFVRLTARGIKHADAIGSLFFSERVCRLIDSFEYDA